MVAGTSYKASRTGANGTPIKGVGVTHCPLIAWVTHTCIIKVAQQTCRKSTNPCIEVINNSGDKTKRPFDKPITCFSNWALAEERSYAVMARGPIEANSYGAIINVLTAIISSPAINTDTGMAPDGVEASTSIMAGIWLHETLVDILSTVLS